MPPQTPPPSADSSPIGELIREARNQMSMSQDALAREIGVRERTISMWECGHHRPRGAHLRAIAQATGKPLSYFKTVTVVLQAVAVLGVM